MNFRSIFQNILIGTTLGSLVSCNPADYAGASGVTIIDEGTPENPKRVHVLMQESFERNELIQPPSAKSPWGWQGFIWDYGTPVIGTSGTNVAAIIMSDTKMGYAPDGTRALYFYGREGYSIHNIFLYTRPYDLTEFESVQIDFNYLTFGLNDSNDAEPEFLKVEVCANSLENCGLSPTNYTKMKSTHWVTLFEADKTKQKANLTGKNHRATDWLSARINVDISLFLKRKTFTFRFNAKMSDGFIGNNTANNLVDGAAVDNIRVQATTFDPLNPPPEVDCRDVNWSIPDSCHHIEFDSQ